MGRNSKRALLVVTKPQSSVHRGNEPGDYIAIAHQPGLVQPNKKTNRKCREPVGCILIRKLVIADRVLEAHATCQIIDHVVEIESVARAIGNSHKIINSPTIECRKVYASKP